MVETNQKEHPILFNSEMVRAVLDGRKTQTRRVIKPKTLKPAKGVDPERDFKDIGSFVEIADGCYKAYLETFKGVAIGFIKCPYGQVGDRLWVRETWKYLNGDKTRVGYKASPETYTDQTFVRLGNWKPSIHMFKKDSRITLEITAIRVERVQDISISDIASEGVKSHPPLAGQFREERDERILSCRRWVKLWDSINKKRGYGWEVNPWVWVVDFKRTEQVK